jgi:hypothetical protein
MAGRGPAPKALDQRRNHHEPLRGEWTSLHPLKKAVLPCLPRDEWSSRTRAAWAAWRRDPATVMYGPAEVQLAVDLAYVYEQWVQDPTAALAAEIRQRQDGLGLSPKGKQDRRWRVTAAAEERESPAEVADIRPLRAVE